MKSVIQMKKISVIMIIIKMKIHLMEKSNNLVKRIII